MTRYHKDGRIDVDNVGELISALQKLDPDMACGLSSDGTPMDTWYIHKRFGFEVGVVSSVVGSSRWNPAQGNAVPALAIGFGEDNDVKTVSQIVESLSKVNIESTLVYKNQNVSSSVTWRNVGLWVGLCDPSPQDHLDRLLHFSRSDNFLIKYGRDKARLVPAVCFYGHVR